MKKVLFPAVIFLFCAAGTLFLGESCARGVSEGLALAAGSFIPATLPLYFLTAFLAASPLSRICEKPAAPLCRLFRLPREAAGAAVAGLLGGYPAAAVAARGLREKGVLTDGAAAKAALCFAAPGPAYAVWAVGGKMLGSAKAGIILLVSVWLANLACASITRVPEGKSAERTLRRGWSAAFSGAVSSSAYSCLLAAASAGLFSGAAEAVLHLLGKLGAEGPLVGAAVLPIFEVTRGCAAAAGSGRWAVPLTAAALGFGGLSVLTQLCCFCEGFYGVGKVLFTGLSKAVLSAGFAALLVPVFRPELKAAAEEAVAAAHEFQITGALFMLFTAFALCLPGALFKPEPLELPLRKSYNYTGKGADR